MFTLSDVEQERAHKWLAEHTCLFTKEHSTGASGGRISYIFTPTSLGTCIQVKCACGADIDITDISDW